MIFYPRFSKRKLILISLYLSAFSSIICAIVANFILLLLSRALLGFCCGLRYNTLFVWAAELASSKEILDKIFMITSIFFAVGGMWSSVSGYLLLDLIGWRMFLLCSTLPIVICPIFMLHFCFKKTEAPKLEDEQGQQETLTVPNYAARTTKLGLLIACVTFNGWLTTLLVPALIKMLKIKEAGPNIDCSFTMTQGAELLFLALVNFAAIPSSLLMHWIKDKIGFRKIQGLVALLYIGNFALMLTQQNLPVAIFTNCMAKFLHAIISLSTMYVLYDSNYYGTKKFDEGSSIASTIGLIGGMVGSGMVAFTPTSYVIITALVVSIVEVLVVFSMTEVQ